MAVVLHTAALGGAELHLLRVVGELAASREVLVLLGEDGPLAQLLTDAGSLVEVVPFNAALGLFGRRGFRRPTGGGTVRGSALSSIRSTRRRVAALHRDGYVVLLGTVKSALPLLASRGLSRCWLDVHEPLDPPYMSIASGYLCRRLASFVHGAIVRTESAGRRLQGLGRVVVIPPVSDAVTTAVDEAHRGPEGVQRIACVGRISWLKGQDRLLDIAERCPTAHFLIAGSPLPQEESFARNVRDRAELLPNVHIQQHLAASQLREVYTSTDVVLLLPRAPESYGLVMVEAMAHGCAVIAPSFPSFVQLGAGYPLVKFYDPVGDVRAQVGHLLNGFDVQRMRQQRASARRAPVPVRAVARRYADVLFGGEPTATGGRASP